MCRHDTWATFARKWTSNCHPNLEDAPKQPNGLQGDPRAAQREPRGRQSRPQGSQGRPKDTQRTPKGQDICSQTADQMPKRPLFWAMHFYIHMYIYIYMFFFGQGDLKGTQEEAFHTNAGSRRAVAHCYPLDSHSGPLSPGI